MRFKTLGDTTQIIPDIGLGTWRYTGGPEPFRAAVALGAWHIDTAERYGTEEAVAQGIRGLKRSDVFIATKVRPENLRYADVVRAADESLRRLDTDYIDLYQVHKPNPQIPIGETMQAFDRLVEAGKVRFIGVTSFSVVQFEAAQATIPRKIVSNQVGYSLADRTVETELIPYCQRNDVTVIAYSPLARGLENLRRVLRGDALRRVARSEGRSEAQVALNWCIAKKNVVVITRTSSVEHVEDVCGASGWTLSPASMEILDSTYVGRTQVPCDPCRAEGGPELFEEP